MTENIGIALVIIANIFFWPFVILHYFFCWKCFKEKESDWDKFWAILGPLDAATWAWAKNQEDPIILKLRIWHRVLFFLSLGLLIIAVPLML